MSFKEEISKVLKNNKMTVTSLAESCHVTRQKMYQIMNDPSEHLTPELVMLMADAINISPVEILFMADQKQNADNDSGEAIKQQIRAFFELPSPLNETLGEFSFNYTTENGTYSTTSSEAAKIIRNYLKEPIVDQTKQYIFRNFECTLYNSVEIRKASLIARLLNHLVHEEGDDVSHVTLAHFLPEWKQENLSSLDTIHLVKQIYPFLSTVTDYRHFLGVPIEENGLFRNSDICLMTYTKLVVDRNQSIIEAANAQNRIQSAAHFIIRANDDYTVDICPVGFGNSLRCYQDKTNVNHLFRFLSPDTAHIKPELYLDPLSITRHMETITSSKSAFSLSDDLFFDHFPAEIWQSLLSRIASYDPEILKPIAKVLSRNSFSLHSDIKDVLTDAISTLDKRYRNSIFNNKITIIRESAFRRFAGERMIDSLALLSGHNPFIKLNDDEMKTAVRSIKESIQTHITNRKQIGGIYIMRTDYPNNPALTNDHMISLHQFDNRLGMSTLRADVSQDLSIENFFTDDRFCALLMDYVRDELIAKRNEKDSIIMSDVESLNFIDTLFKDYID